MDAQMKKQTERFINIRSTQVLIPPSYCCPYPCPYCTPHSPVRIGRTSLSLSFCLLSPPPHSPLSTNRTHISLSLSLSLSIPLSLALSISLPSPTPPPPLLSVRIGRTSLPPPVLTGRTSLL